MSFGRRVGLEIKFEVSYQYEDGDICSIDLYGLTSTVSAESVHSIGQDSHLREGSLKWRVPNTDKVRRLSETEKLVDQISLTAEKANAIRLTARVFQPYKDLSNLVRNYDGTITPLACVRRLDIPIAIKEHPECEAGNSYLIRIQNIGGCSLQATFISRNNVIKGDSV